MTRDGRLVIDDPEIRRKLIEVIDSYTAFYRKGCTPPDAVNWATGDRNNEAFLAQTVVMTQNATLSLPNALKRERPDDYYENTATIEWPLGPSGEPFPIVGSVHSAVVFKDGAHVATAKEFVRFLVGEGWLAHYLDFSGERMLPPMPKLLDAAVLARPERPAPHGRGDAGQLAPAALTTTRRPRATGGTAGFGRSSPGPRRSTASPPRASAPSRRSTRRSRGSSRS